MVYVAADGQYLGRIEIADTIKEHAAAAIQAMKAAGVHRTILLSGDRREAAEQVGGALQLSEVHAELLPAGKVDQMEQIMQGAEKKVAFVGDGINDAPVLMRADVGIAMGSLGSDAAIEAADIVLMDDDIRKIAAVIRLARRTLRIVRQNVVFALVVKMAVLVLGALGLASMWLAVFADVGVAVLCILNSMRVGMKK